ncbi:hypothetical protein [Streptomyces sp. NPDC048196]|uniref:hypothetical protein n=1 Tax=Streptomyces sp. NPDC048196 TaxID=3154712 RepID=UPI003407BF83
MPADARIEEVAAVGGPLKKYRVTSPSGAETVMKLNTADAEARGLGEDDLATAAPARRGAAEDVTLPEGDGASGEPEAKKAPPAPNKARTTSANKGRGARGGS